MAPANCCLTVARVEGLKGEDPSRVLFGVGIYVLLLALAFEGAIAPDFGENSAAGDRCRRNLVPPDLYHVRHYAKTPEDQHPSGPPGGP